MIDKAVFARKKRIIRKLQERGITDFEITYLPYLEFDESTFATPHEVGARMIILYSCAYVANNLSERKEIRDWLKKESLWPHVSPNEQELFEGRVSKEEKLGSFSWNVEAAYTLAWTLGIISELHPPTRELNEKELIEFQSRKPTLGEPIGDYFEKLRLRDKAEIFEENILNEIATTYFRDLLFNGKKDTTDIDRYVSFERHVVLNWLRRFSDIKDWDDTDTST